MIKIKIKIYSVLIVMIVIIVTETVGGYSDRYRLGGKCTSMSLSLSILMFKGLSMSKSMSADLTFSLHCSHLISCGLLY